MELKVDWSKAKAGAESFTQLREAGLVSFWAATIKHPSLPELIRIGSDGKLLEFSEYQDAVDRAKKFIEEAIGGK